MIFVGVTLINFQIGLRGTSGKWLVTLDRMIDKRLFRFLNCFKLSCDILMDRLKFQLRSKIGF